MNRLKTKREERGMSQSQLAKASGVAVRNIQAYEQGENDIKKAQVQTVIALADALECDIREIVE